MLKYEQEKVAIQNLINCINLQKKAYRIIKIYSIQFILIHQNYTDLRYRRYSVLNKDIIREKNSLLSSDLSDTATIYAELMVQQVKR